DAAAQSRLGDHAPAPDLLVDFGPGHHAPGAGDQQRDQLDHLRLDVDRRGAAAKLVAVGIEGVLAEAVAHGFGQTSVNGPGTWKDGRCRRQSGEINKMRAVTVMQSTLATQSPRILQEMIAQPPSVTAIPRAQCASPITPDTFRGGTIMTSNTAQQRSLDVLDLEQRVKSMYRDVARNPHGEFHFEMGRALAERLGYRPGDLDRIPAESIESF